MDLTNTVRRTIYAALVSTGRVPTVLEIATQSGLDERNVRAACRSLADAHVLILRPDGRELWAAPPFCAVPTSFRVHAASQSWYAACAWDAFGIPASVKTDVDIDARCAWSGEPLPAGVRNGNAYGRGLIHLEVPARHFWDDIIYT